MHVNQLSPLVRELRPHLLYMMVGSDRAINSQDSRQSRPANLTRIESHSIKEHLPTRLYLAHPAAEILATPKKRSTGTIPREEEVVAAYEEVACAVGRKGDMEDHHETSTGILFLLRMLLVRVPPQG